MSGPIDGTIVAFSIVSGVKRFVRLSTRRGLLSSVQLAWLDATSAYSAPVLYVSNSADPATPANDASPSLADWDVDTSLSFAALTAGAAGSEMSHSTSNGAKWLLVEISATANCSLELRPHSKE